MALPPRTSKTPSRVKFSSRTNFPPRDRFLKAMGWDGTAVTKLRQDASLRSYFRLTKPTQAPPQTAVLMDSPEGIEQFLGVSLLLRKAGIHSPAIYGLDKAAGLMLLEDFGNNSFSNLLADNPTTGSTPTSPLPAEADSASHSSQTPTSPLPSKADRTSSTNETSATSPKTTNPTNPLSTNSHSIKTNAANSHSPKANPASLYHLALETLLKLHRAISPQLASTSLPPYDSAAFAGEHNLVTRWCYQNLPTQAKQALDQTLRDLLAQLEMPQCVVLRDYHVDNLMLLPQSHLQSPKRYLKSPQSHRQSPKSHRQSPKSRSQDCCGVLDFQDALVGPVGYDLASLLDDVRYRLEGTLKKELMAKAAEGYGTPMASLEKAVDILSAQRLIKIFGIFHRLATEGKPHYLAYLGLCGELLTQRLAKPTLVPLAQWFRKHPLKGVRV